MLRVSRLKPLRKAAAKPEEPAAPAVEVTEAESDAEGGE